MKRKDYERPTMRVVEIRQHGMLMQSGGAEATGKTTLGNSYTDGGGDAWSGGSGSGGSSMGGWTNNGGDAWE